MQMTVVDRDDERVAKRADDATSDAEATRRYKRNSSSDSRTTATAAVDHDKRHVDEDDGNDDDDGDDSATTTTTTAAAAAAAAAAGMRREWNFTLTFAHQRARLRLQCAPAWQHRFIDDTDVAQLARLDRDVTHSPLTPIVSYSDTTSVIAGDAAAATTTTTTPMAAGVEALAGNHGGGAMTANALLARSRATSLTTTTAAATASAAAARVSIASSGTTTTTTTTTTMPSHHGETAVWWLEKTKHVELLYAHVAPDTTLAQFCKACVRYMLHHAHLVAIDGDTRLGSLRVGRKLDCAYRLGGHRSFHFYARLRNRLELADEHVYALGTCVHAYGYLALVHCSDVAELRAYIAHVFLPTYTDVTRLQLNVDVRYHAVASVLLEEQQARHGELRYRDRDARVSFALPMHPLTARPDFSPAKTVGVGSIACMTLDVHVYERLIDDAVVAEIAGMPRYRHDTVVLCLDVEDVVRMGYPSILSTEQYSALKLQRLLDVFADARTVGTATTVPLGRRPGRGRTVTFYYEPLQGVVKAMLVSCLVGGSGVTALYLTKLTGSSFDTHLYLMQQLLHSVTYHVEHRHDDHPQQQQQQQQQPLSRHTRQPPGRLRAGSSSGSSTAPLAAATVARAWTRAAAPFSRHCVANVRLLEADLPHVYLGSSGGSSSSNDDTDNDDDDGHQHSRDDHTADASSATAASACAVDSDDKAARGGAAATTMTTMTMTCPATTRTTAAPEARRALEQHVQLMRCINDGAVGDGAVFVHVAYEEGGLAAVTAAAAATATAKATGATDVASVAAHAMRAMSNDTDTPPPSTMRASGSGQTRKSSEANKGRDASGTPHEDDNNNNSRSDDDCADDDVLSLHSRSLISVGSVAQLQNMRGDSSDDDDDAAGATGGSVSEDGGSSSSSSGGASDHTSKGSGDSVVNATGVSASPSRHKQDENKVTGNADTHAIYAHSESAAPSTTDTACTRQEHNNNNNNSNGATSRASTTAAQSQIDDNMDCDDNTDDNIASAQAATPIPPLPQQQQQQEQEHASSPSSSRRASGAATTAADAAKRAMTTTAANTTVDVDDAIAAVTSAAQSAEVRLALADNWRRIVVDRNNSGSSKKQREDVNNEAKWQTDDNDANNHANNTDNNLVATVQNTERAHNGMTTWAMAKDVDVTGTSLRDVYVRCCEWQRCRPNSHLLQKLPADPQLTALIEELDLTANYVGNAGFVAVLLLLRHIPRLRRVYFDDMQLDNADVENLCEVLATQATVEEVYLRRNPKITLPSTRFLTRLLRSNASIRVLVLDGTRLGDAVIARLQADAAAPRHNTAAPPPTFRL